MLTSPDKAAAEEAILEAIDVATDVCFRGHFGSPVSTRSGPLLTQIRPWMFCRTFGLGGRELSEMRL
jgi:hypothetical protein